MANKLWVARADLTHQDIAGVVTVFNWFHTSEEKEAMKMAQDWASKLVKMGATVSTLRVDLFGTFKSSE